MFTYDANGNLLTAGAPYSISLVTYDEHNLPLHLTRSVRNWPCSWMAITGMAGFYQNADWKRSSRHSERRHAATGWQNFSVT